MIHGIGTDIVSNERIARLYARYGERFAKRLLSGQELHELRSKKDPARFIAKRFAAKEAIVKAIGTGFQHGFQLTAITIRNESLGKPVVEFSPHLQARCSAMHLGECHISISDEEAHSIAFAVMMRS